MVHTYVCGPAGAAEINLKVSNVASLTLLCLAAHSATMEGLAGQFIAFIHLAPFADCKKFGEGGGQGGGGGLVGGYS